MKSVSLRDEIAIMHNTRGYHISKPYATRGNHYSSLKAAINAAKKGNLRVAYVTKTTPNARCITVASIINRSDFYEIVIW
jgi:hypothetical protein